jgi:hypothetical protein
MTKLYQTNSLNEDNFRPPMEDNINVIKMEYLSNHLWDPTQILNLSLDDQATNPLNGDDLHRKMASEYYNWNISATTLWTVNYEFLVRN